MMNALLVAALCGIVLVSAPAARASHAFARVKKRHRPAA